MSKIKIKIDFSIGKSRFGCSNKRFEIRESTDYKIIKYCCDDFKEATKEDFIGLDDDKSFTTTNFGLSIQKFISYPDDYYRDWMQISYCPFCGKKIEIELKEKHSILYSKIKKYQKQKTSFLKGLNLLLLLIRINSQFDDLKNKNRKFIYKYGMNKFQFIEEKGITYKYYSIRGMD